jgi:hypothetical protein
MDLKLDKTSNYIFFCNSMNIGGGEFIFQDCYFLKFINY